MSANSPKQNRIRAECGTGAGMVVAAMTAATAAAIIGLGWLSYGRLIIGVAAAPLALLFPRVYRRRLEAKRRRKLLLQFRDMLLSVSASLSAGRSLENAFRQAVTDLDLLYYGQDIEMTRELAVINSRIAMREPVEEPLRDFAARAGLDDVVNFTDVFTISRRSGGNMVEVIRNTCQVINRKIDVLEEIDIIAAEKMLSFKIMLAMPAAFMLLMLTTSRDYMTLLYTGAGGVAMTAALAVIAAAYYAGTKITDIRTRY